jgi:hypothetical protein
MCVSVGRHAFDLLHKAVQNPDTLTIDIYSYGDTFAAREWLRKVTREGQQENNDTTFVPALALVVVADYNPEEIWSLTTMMTQLLDLEPLVQAHVVLITEGWRWTLPVLVADFPRLTLIPKGAAGREAVGNLLSRIIQGRTGTAPN